MQKKQRNINPALRDFDSLPNHAQVRLPVVKGILSVSGATVWRMVRAGKLKTYKLTERTTTFNVGEIRTFLADKAGV
jgi:predicted DNA-binding transcriptional regulator AlpA